jgi:hypothetical protein
MITLVQMGGKVNIAACSPFPLVIYFTKVAEKFEIPFKNCSWDSNVKEVLPTLIYIAF